MNTDQRSTARATWGSGDSVVSGQVTPAFAPVQYALRNVFMVPGA